MNTREFFEKILPSGGNKVLVELVPYQDPATGDMKEGKRHLVFASIAEMAEAACQIDAAGRNVYHACNGFGDWYERTDPKTGKTRKSIRTQENVVACRTLFDDIDVGKPGGYATKREAVQAVGDFVGASGIPMPMIVSSGGGIHLYWPLDQDVSRDEWKRLSVVKRTAIDHFGLLVDHAVGTDEARFLRPLGTHNRKRETPRDVKLLLDAPVTTSQAIGLSLLKYAQREGFLLPKRETPR